MNLKVGKCYVSQCHIVQIVEGGWKGVFLEYGKICHNNRVVKMSLEETEEYLKSLGYGPYLELPKEVGEDLINKLSTHHMLEYEIIDIVYKHAK